MYIQVIFLIFQHNFSLLWFIYYLNLSYPLYLWNIKCIYTLLTFYSIFGDTEINTNITSRLISDFVIYARHSSNNSGGIINVCSLFKRYAKILKSLMIALFYFVSFCTIACNASDFAEFSSNLINSRSYHETRVVICSQCAYGQNRFIIFN